MKADAIRFEPTNIIDPFCLFSCDDDEPDTVVQNITNTNSNNVDSYNTINTTNNNTGGSNQDSISPIVYNEIYTGRIYETPTNNYSNYSYNYDYPYNYNNNYNNNSNYNNYPQLTATCYANTSRTTVGTNVVWRAYASGGNGSYTYSWSGTDGKYGYSNILSTYYNTSGIKSASVRVYSNGSQTNVQCSNIVIDPIYYNNYNPTYITPTYITPTYVNPVYINPNDIQLGCSADKISTTIGSPITWVTEVYPNNQIYTYAWTGTDGISSNQSSFVKYYNTSGLKSASVTVTNQYGQSRSQACTNTVSVKSKQYIPVKVVPVESVEKVPVEKTNDDLSAASLFSLKGVPWGWVAVLVILILFGTVVYLLVNRRKL